MNVKIANVNRKSKSLNYIDSKMKKMLAEYDLSNTVSGKYHPISNDIDILIVERVMNEINDQINSLQSFKNQTQESTNILNYYRGIKYVLIKEHLKKVKVYSIHDGGGRIRTSPLLEIDRKNIDRCISNKGKSNKKVSPQWPRTS